MSSKLVELEKLLICNLFSAKDTILLDTCLIGLSERREDSNIQRLQDMS